MKTITEIRRENLLLLAEKYGSLAAISEAIGKKRTDPTLRQIKIRAISPKGTARNMGHYLARLIEEKLALPSGWMDQDHRFSNAKAEELEELKRPKANTKPRTFVRIIPSTVKLEAGVPAYEKKDEVRCPTAVLSKRFLEENGYQLKDLRGLIAPEAIPSISICKGDITVINTAIRNPRQGSSTIFAYIRPACSVYFAAGREPTREDLPLGKLIALVRRC